jgi:hypothetical protein
MVESVELLKRNIGKTLQLFVKDVARHSSLKARLSRFNIMSLTVQSGPEHP